LKITLSWPSDPKRVPFFLPSSTFKHFAPFSLSHLFRRWIVLAVPPLPRAHDPAPFSSQGSLHSPSLCVGAAPSRARIFFTLRLSLPATRRHPCPVPTVSHYCIPFSRQKIAAECPQQDLVVLHFFPFSAEGLPFLAFFFFFPRTARFFSLVWVPLSRTSPSDPPNPPQPLRFFFPSRYGGGKDVFAPSSIRCFEFGLSGARDFVCNAPVVRCGFGTAGQWFRRCAIRLPGIHFLAY